MSPAKKNGRDGRPRYGAHAEGVIGLLAAHLLAAPSRLTRADRMCRVEEMIARIVSCLFFEIRSRSLAMTSDVS